MSRLTIVGFVFALSFAGHRSIAYAVQEDPVGSPLCRIIADVNCVNLVHGTPTCSSYTCGVTVINNEYFSRCKFEMTSSPEDDYMAYYAIRSSVTVPTAIQAPGGYWGRLNANPTGEKVPCLVRIECNLCTPQLYNQSCPNQGWGLAEFGEQDKFALDLNSAACQGN